MSQLKNKIESFNLPRETIEIGDKIEKWDKTENWDKIVKIEQK